METAFLLAKAIVFFLDLLAIGSLLCDDGRTWDREGMVRGVVADA